MESRTKSERFVRVKKAQWQQLHTILLALNRQGFRGLPDEAKVAFPRLFRLTCADLAEAKMLKLSPDVLDYLNQLVGQAHKYLYSFPPLQKSQVKLFFRRQLPQVVRNNWLFVALAAFFFFTSYTTAYLLVRPNPAAAGLVIPQATLDQMTESYRAPITAERPLSLKNFMVAFYIQNNVSIAFASFALGVLLGLGTIYLLIYNGIFLGAISGYIIGSGYRKQFITFITAHSVFELTGLILAGAAGLALGFAIIKATRYYRREWLALQRPNILTLVAASALLLLGAAGLEGLLSPSLLPFAVKAGVAVASLAVLVGYFGIWPGILRRRRSLSLEYRK
ncbi:MAG: stage II sporulation protein M [Bacillota bacterium]|jgi:uncharacterized membrane protein SpoIIM required for sporulation